MTLSRKELARELRGVNLQTFSMLVLGAFCQRLGQSGRGTREELVKRVYHQIWRREYDGNQEETKR